MKNVFGLPLAIKIVIDYLYSIDNIEIWDQICTVYIWDIPSVSMKSIISMLAYLRT